MREERRGGGGEEEDEEEQEEKEGRTEDRKVTEATPWRWQPHRLAAGQGEGGGEGGAG